MSVDIAVEPNDLITMVIYGRLYGSEVRNSYHYVNSHTEDIDLLASFAGLFEEQCKDAIRGMSTPDLSYYNIRLDVWENTGVDFISRGWRDYTIDWQGSRNALNSALPANNAVVMRRRVGPAGRANRGRVYIAGVPSGDCLSGVVGPGSYSAVIDAFKLQMAQAIHDATPIDLATPVLVKWDAEGQPDSFQTVNFWDHNPYVRSQRRREKDVGI